MRRLFIILTVCFAFTSTSQPSRAANSTALAFAAASDPSGTSPFMVFTAPLVPFALEKIWNNGPRWLSDLGRWCRGAKECCTEMRDPFGTFVKGHVDNNALEVSFRRFGEIMRDVIKAKKTDNALTPHQRSLYTHLSEEQRYSFETPNVSVYFEDPRVSPPSLFLQSSKKNSRVLENPYEAPPPSPLALPQIDLSTVTIAVRSRADGSSGDSNSDKKGSEIESKAGDSPTKSSIHILHHSSPSVADRLSLKLKRTTSSNMKKITTFNDILGFLEREFSTLLSGYEVDQRNLFTKLKTAHGAGCINSACLLHRELTDEVEFGVGNLAPKNADDLEAGTIFKETLRVRMQFRKKFPTEGDEKTLLDE